MTVTIFRRIEKKYLLNEDTYNKLMEQIKEHLEEDYYYKSTICNIYFDNDNNDLIIKSLDKPLFKEKIRLRSYGIPTLDNDVYLEIKSKCYGIVNKRRIAIKLKDFYNCLNKEFISDNKQIADEINYYIKLNNLKPHIFLGYNRLSYYDKDNKDFRITFDTNIRSRYDDLRLEEGDAGKLLFNEKVYIMEVKVLGALPMWFVNILSSLNIYPESFSKYGNIYMKNFKEESYV